MKLLHFPLRVPKRAAFACALLLPLVTCSLTAHAITDKEEIEYGKKYASQVFFRFGSELPASHPLSKRVTRVGMPFAKLSKRSGITYSYHVLDNDDVVNALALPGGSIYITSRLVKAMANDAELAAILAHETAHVDKRHTAERLEKRESAQNVTSKLSQWFLGKGEHSSIKMTTDLTFGLFSLGYRREKESEADAWSARWLSQLGYHPSAIVTALGRLPHADKPSELEKIVSSHPPIVQRQIELRQLITREKLMDIAIKHGGPFFWSHATKKPSRSNR